MLNFQFLHGEPDISARFKAEIEDFAVTERLGFDIAGEGEHVFIRVQKRDENTQYLARQIAKVAGLPAKAVTYAGLKDKRGVTEQTFSVHIPGLVTPDFSELNNEQVTILEIKRHNKKLKTGALAGNSFVIRLRDVSDIAALESRLAIVKAHGVPNYFGEQRFGFQGGNIEAAKAMFAGKKIKDRFKKSMYLSAARSYLFNLVVSARIKDGIAEQVIAGDCCGLVGSRSYFTTEALDDTLPPRLAAKNIQLTAPLWGKGELASNLDALAFEQGALEGQTELQQGLEANGLRQERRAMLIQPQEFNYRFEGSDAILEFYLESGCYATSVVRELVRLQD
ncbi:tRNA pseudouridine(13) synthase TruD [Motilimonas pumila]|uniref:tRNA pseudouridine synthase D n=1 Tax=Motilimonas pumila TaxID=2303987 RepID=A0A418YAJ2_9GAMM|nr:tRNA pseudouridine(13) synthase TruD [Motilimonas pumila]RJG39992.1 tRNA pseudouridine(13) synthase TruD [Motilimonas pumila]